MLMLIAPSKTQTPSNTSVVASSTQPLFLQESAALIEELQQLSIGELGSLMKMSDRLAGQTHDRVHAFRLPFTKENASPALFTFQGDVYSRIDSRSYGQKELEYVQDHLCILSGLYGVLRPLDLMQPYRLEMGCKLVNSRGKNLYEFWASQVTEAIKQMLVHHQEQILVNLASTEYIRVLQKKELRGQMLQVDFRERKGDGYRTVAIHAKRARGMMVDFAVRNKVEAVHDLIPFEEDGYRFHEDLSKEQHFVFTRG